MYLIVTGLLFFFLAMTQSLETALIRSRITTSVAELTGGRVHHVYLIGPANTGSVSFENKKERQRRREGRCEDFLEYIFKVNMGFDFVIPMNRKDLRSKAGVNQYVVDEVLPVRLMSVKLQDCRQKYHTRGATSILQCFDTFYSLLVNFGEIDNDRKEDAWDLLVKGMRQHTNQLGEILDSEKLSEQREVHLNTVKMQTYLLCQMMEEFEMVVSKPVLATGKSRRKVKARDEDLGNIHWEAERDKGMRVMLQMCQLSLHRLWDPPVIEDEFVTMVTNVCYKMLENPDVCKDKTSRDTIFNLLAVMNKKYSHDRGCSVKIIQLLQNYEHLAPHLACAVELFAKDHGVRGIVGDIMREIGRIDPKDLARDTTGTKSYAQFLVDLAEKIPDTMLAYISVVIGLLDEESYTMRNSILGVLGEMVVRVLSSEGLDQKMKQTRDQFLDKLEDHIHDVHAFVRSKCLQIWQHILNEKAVPLPRLLNLLNLTIGRVMDKSSQVRRYAVQNLSLMLRMNPFAAKLSLEELKENYVAEKKLLEEMLSKVPETAPVSPMSKELEEEWNSFARDLKRAARSVLEGEAEEKEDHGGDHEDNAQEEEDGKRKDEVTEEDSVDMVKQRLIELLRNQSYIKAVRLWLSGQESFTDHPAFTALTVEQRETEDDEVLEKRKLCGMLCCMRCIFTGDEIRPSETTQSGEQNVIVNEVTKKQVLVQYLKDSMNFTMAVEQAVPVVCQLLGSKNTSDVLEAINFFVTGFEFGVSNAIMGVRRMLVLIWSKEAGIKEAVVSAYRRLYLNPDGTRANSRARCVAILNNLTALTVGATMGDLTSLEELICEFVRTRDIGESVVQMMWERFALKIPNTTATESRTALVLLGMAAGADVDLVRSNIDVLVKEGLGPRAEEDFYLGRDTCTVLLKLAGGKQARGAVAGEPFRLQKDHEMFSRLAHLIVSGASALQKAGWVPMAEQAINVIYKLAEQPDELCASILKHLVTNLYDQSNAEDPVVLTQESDDGYGSQATSGSQEVKCPAVVLTRLLSVAGHIALRQLVHLDVSIYGELKRRQSLQEKLEEDKRSPPKKRKSTVSSTPGNRSKSKNKDEDELTAEEEMGLMGATAEDREAEFMRKVTETELLSEGNLLSVCSPIIVAVCSNRTRYSDSDLQSAASLALAKFMLISPDFCEQHLQLLFSILEKSPNPTIRANTIIALGDLTFRFPNLIEPWTPNLYARLRDESPKVRKNSTMVLTHLILNDMVKVKGNISELASCIVDQSEEISNLAKLFFHELSMKGNAIYNIMPDMVSRLSDPEVGVDEDSFRIIMRYLFGFIQKDRQCESLVEKLCHRFRATRVERQWRDLAFCLSMLTFSDKSIRKLQENFPCFADKLSDEDVYNSFATILKGANKFAKAETKVLLEELEQRIEESHSKGVEEDEVAYKASKFAAKAKGKKTPSKTPGRRGRARKTSHRSQRSSQDSEDDARAGESEEEYSKPRGRKTKPRLTFSSDEEKEEEEVGGKRLAISDPDDPQVQAPGRDIKGDPKDCGGSKKSSDTENADPNVSSQDSPLIKKKSHKLSAHTQRLAAASPAPRRGRRHPVKTAE